MTVATAKPASATTRKKPLPEPKRVIAARVRLVREGTTVVAWAAAHEESPALVAKVLSGKRSCVRGDSRRIAIKLGIVDDVSAAPTGVACDRQPASQPEIMA